MRELSPDLSERVYTTGEVAKICRLSNNIVQKLFDSGKIRGYKLPPDHKYRIIPHNCLVEFAKENQLECLLDDYFGKGKY